MTLIAEPRWRALAVLAFARVAMGFQFQSIAATSPLLSHDLHLEQSQIGWLIGLYLLPGVAIALPGGLLGARFGDKRMVLWGLVLMGAGGLGLAFATSIEAAYAWRLVSGIGAVVFNVLLTKLVVDWFAGREVVLAMAVLVNSWPVGIGLALLILSPLAQATSWQIASVATTIFCLVGLLSIWRAYTPAPDAAPARWSRLPLREGLLVFVGGFPWLLYNAAYALLVGFLPIYLIRHGAPLTLASALTAVNTLLLIASIQLGGYLAQRWNRATLVAVVGAAIWTLCLVGMLVTQSVPLVWLTLAGLLSGLPAGVLVAVPSQILSPATRSTGMGLFYTVYYAGMALFPPLGGFLADRFGDSSVPIWLSAACSLSTLVMLGVTRWLQSSWPARPVADVAPP